MSSATHWQRIAWLTRTNRVYGKKTEFVSARRFAEAFRRDGRPSLSPSQIIRWESGQVALSSAVILRYERLLELAPNQLLAIADTYATFFNEPTLLAPATQHSDDVKLHKLLDLASSSESMHAENWQMLGVQVSTRPNLLLHPPSLWRSIAEKLLNELVRAEQGAWYIRQAAMSRLLAHPVSAPYMIEACVDMVEDRDNPVFIEPLSLLEAARGIMVNRFVLNETLAPRNESSFQGALLAAISKLRRGHFTITERRELSHASDEIARIFGQYMVSAPLVVDLMETLRRRGSPTAKPTEVRWSRRIATAAQAQLDSLRVEPDDVLEKLVGEALFDHNADSRLYSAAMLAATPYRDPLVTVLIEILKREIVARDDLFVDRILRLLTWLRATDHQQWAGQLLMSHTVPPRVRHAAAWAASHSAGRREEINWRAIVHYQLSRFKANPSPLDQAILRGLVYSIGNEGHDRLLDSLAADPAIPTEMHHLANWWRSNSVVTK